MAAALNKLRNFRYRGEKVNYVCIFSCQLFILLLSYGVGQIAAVEYKAAAVAGRVGRQGVTVGETLYRYC